MASVKLKMNGMGRFDFEDVVSCMHLCVCLCVYCKCVRNTFFCGMGQSFGALATPFIAMFKMLINYQRFNLYQKTAQKSNCDPRTLSPNPSGHFSVCCRARKIIIINQMCRSTCQYACRTPHTALTVRPISNEMRLVVTLHSLPHCRLPLRLFCFQVMTSAINCSLRRQYPTLI